jgi:dynein heavy chain
VKFHYQWNLREITNVSQGLCRMIKENYQEPLKVVRLWVHECERVFLDRLINETDIARYGEFKEQITKKYVDEVPLAEIQERPILYTGAHTPPPLPPNLNPQP